jgi:hypothetical protein
MVMFLNRDKDFQHAWDTDIFPDFMDLSNNIGTIGGQ